MQISTDIAETPTMLELLSTKIGGYCIYLGVMLFLNLYLFFRGRRISRQKSRLAEAAAQLGQQP
ncbi:hypothetical protein ACFOTA_07070 [Chitinophaga sp. GCM10012297]|uniref:CcmD family protein n=1 Tax=Chitinophaga chungangae TaxID=2821488 RepID=A0ABS3YBD4_9BACT|nr:hypothetical protein [Chitinophaga chungangae]MBO9151961.1 hypothetical protein [Chitinophaga chungangae]